MGRRRKGGEKKGGWGCGEVKPSDFGSGREGGADELQARVMAKRATVGRKGRDLRVFLFFFFAAIEMQCTKNAKNKKALKASAARRAAHSNRVISSSDDF